jgi:hypothetical protein
MGSLLFLAYINDLLEATSSSARLFADDCLLFRRIRKIKDAVDLQNDLSLLEEWERKWQMGDFQKNEDFSFSENNFNIK